MRWHLLVRKTIFNIVVYGVYYTPVFYFVKPVIFADVFFSVYIAILYISGILDTYLRPLESEEREEENFVKYILLLFLANPWLFVLSIGENEWLFDQRIDTFSWIGLIIYFSAACLIILARIQLGDQATGTLVIRKNHQLVDSGIYKYVRNPMYFGLLLGVKGFWLVSQAIMVPLFTLILYIWVFMGRIRHEEKLLKEHYGDAYDEYMSRTKKLIPIIY